MRLNHIFIVSLMLAILTFGAVSASEDVNNLTVVDDAAAISTDDVAETVSQVEEVDLIAGDDSGDEVLSEEKQKADHDEILPDDIRMGETWFEDYDRETYVGIKFYDEDIGGTVKFYVDGDLKSSQDAVYYWDSDEKGVHYDLLENDIAVGMHDITIKYSGDNKYAPFNINHKVELYYMKANVPETVFDGSLIEGFRINFAMEATGYLDLYLDDNFVATFDVEDDRYEYYFEKTPYLLIHPSNYVSLGEHRYTAKYYGGNYADKTVEGVFTLDYLFEVEEYGNSYYGEPIRFAIGLPDDATNNITLSVKGKTYTIVNENGGEFYYEFDDAPYGENNFVFSYGDNKYPMKNVTIKLDVKGEINSIYEEVPYLSDEGNITLVLPDDAKGNLTIYEFDDDVNTLIATAKLVNGKASISLSNLAIGEHNIISEYVGEDYDVESVEFNFDVVPNVEYPKGIWNESKDVSKITVLSPSDDARLTIEIYTAFNSEYDSYYFEYDEFVMEIYSGDAKGTVSQRIPDLETGVYAIRVIYEKDNIPMSNQYYKLVVKDVTPDWTMEVNVPKEVAKGDEYYDEYGGYEFWPENLPDGQAWLTLYIDGKYVTSRGVYDDGELTCAISELSIGTHTWKVTYEGNDYFNDASAEGSFEVVWISIPEKVIDGETTIECHMDKNATGYISLSIDGKNYGMEFVEDGYASFTLGNLTFGEHAYEFSYSGDANHPKLTKTGSFKNTMYFEMNSWLDYHSSSVVRDSYPVIFKVPGDATGIITVTVGDKTYTQNVVNGIASFEINDLEIGHHKLVAKYSGDGKYPASEISNEFDITGYGIFLEYSNDEDEEFISVSITLPSDATGKLVIYDDTDDEVVKEAILENGKAKILASDLNLPFGRYSFKVVFEGDEIYDFEEWFDFENDPIINVPDSVNIGEDARIQMDLDDVTGKIVISINGEEFKTVEIENGKIDVSIPADKLPKNNNEVTFFYVGEDMSNDPFGSYDDDKFVPFMYQLRVELKEIGLPEKFNGTGNITLKLPEDATGNVTVYVDDKKVLTTPATGGINTLPLSDLAIGGHSVSVVYKDKKGNKYSSEEHVLLVIKPEPKMDIASPTDSTTPEFSISLPEDATGTLIVNVDGKNYVADLVKGKATVSVPNLTNGNHNVAVKYSGDKKYSGFAKNTNVVVNSTPKKEDAPKTPVKKADKITLKLQKVKKVKKSAKKLVIKATLKINGKAVKGKKLKFKFNKKTYTAKTNKKGVAKITIKKNVLKKLKVGKKITIQVSYGKKTAKQKIKVKK